jgi:hypothetical protein
MCHIEMDVCPSCGKENSSVFTLCDSGKTGNVCVNAGIRGFCTPWTKESEDTIMHSILGRSGIPRIDMAQIVETRVSDTPCGNCPRTTIMNTIPQTITPTDVTAVVVRLGDVEEISVRGRTTTMHRIMFGPSSLSEVRLEFVKVKTLQVPTRFGNSLMYSIALPGWLATKVRGVGAELFPKWTNNTLGLLLDCGFDGSSTFAGGLGLETTTIDRLEVLFPGGFTVSGDFEIQVSTEDGRPAMRMVMKRGQIVNPNVVGPLITL